MTYHHQWMLMCLLSIVLLSNTTTYAADKINPRTLCPISGSEQQTILLIDTTDALTLVAQERLKQLLQSFLDSKNKHYVQPAHELIVYHLTPRVADMSKLMRVCNPGNPEDRALIDDLTSGVIDARRKWRAFQKRVLQIWRAVPGIDEQVSGKYSPLLESLAVVTARHVPSLGVGEQRKPTRLILFSDMLQNSGLLSHYKSVPAIKSFAKSVGYAEMESDLNGIDVWLFYVRRTGLEHKQTPKHYYWWTQAVELFGGRLIEQVPL